MNSSRADLTILALSLVGLLLSALPLTSEKIFQRFFGRAAAHGDAPAIGAVALAKNDIRHKSRGDLAWKKAKGKEGIRVGDSVFAGDRSNTRVELNSGGVVELEPNSLVTFSRHEQIDVPNLQLGNFRVAVKGTMKIALKGKITEIEGDGSELKVEIKSRNEATVELVTGSATVRQADEVKELEIGHEVALEAVAITDALAEDAFLQDPLAQDPLAQDATAQDATAQDATAQDATSEEALSAAAEQAEQVEAKIVSVRAEGRVEYENLLSDLYETDRAGLRIGSDSNRQKQKRVSVPVSWTLDHPVASGDGRGRVRGQISATKDFAEIQDSLQFDMRAGLKDGEASFSTAVIGDNYVRLSLDGQPWSEPQKVELVARDHRAQPPTLRFQSATLEAESGAFHARGELTGAKAFGATIIEISETAQFARASTRVVEVQSEVFRVRVSPDRALYFRTRGVLASGKVTSVSPTIRQVFSRPEEPEPPAAPLALAPTPSSEITRNEVKRAPTSTGPLREEIQIRIPEAISAKPPLETSLAFEGAAFTMISQKQVQQGKPSPVAFMAGLRWMGWSGAHGLEASFKTRAADFPTGGNSDAAKVSPMQFEARYHRQWSFPWNPFSRQGDARFSLMGGYEVYRNSVRGPYSPGYDLVKGGIGLQFPIAQRWKTGGEALYGLGLDQSSKYELSGHILYYIKTVWSLGMGYRLHFFEAGSKSSSPYGVPYREGFGEGYSVLRWHY